MVFVVFIYEKECACYAPLSTQIPIAKPIYLSFAAFVLAFAFAISRFS